MMLPPWPLRVRKCVTSAKLTKPNSVPMSEKALAHGTACALQRVLAWAVFQPYLMNVCLDLILEARASVTKRDQNKTALVHGRVRP